MQKSIIGSNLRKMLMGAYALLDKNKAHVDSLNVFPVPDGDTGTNMSLTLKSVIMELDGCKSNEIPGVCGAIAKGALKGARGNSGVITSQIFKGMMAELSLLKSGQALTTRVFAKSMAEGSKVAYSAVTVPREGTMLTVIRHMGEEAKKLAGKHHDFEPFLEEVIKAGEEILAQTPEMLPVLKKAGVVDAGGRGLIVIFTGFLQALRGDVDTPDLVFEHDGAISEFSDGEADIEDLSDIEFAYCTEFMITNMNRSTTLASIDTLSEKLQAMGDSVMCVGDLALVKVHVHTNTPGQALSDALRLGEIINIKIDNMLQQNRELRAGRKRPEKEQGIVAVAAGEGLITIFKDLGVDYVIKGGQTMNPSADDIAKAAERVNAKTVFVFPNNKNIVLAARHAQGLVDKNLVVIPTASVNEGITACISFNPDGTVEENTDAFLAAIPTVCSGAVTYAVRNTKVGNFDIKAGEILGLDNKNIIAKGKSVPEATMKVVEKLITDTHVSITLFFGADVKEKDAFALQDKVQTKYPNCEVSAINGGQPVYYYLVSLE